ncbi:MAG: peptide chain release factor 2 [Actinomycetota bacterium]|nr:MAG: peptide chain release factor 2 [Actinomycetota bacterium]
MPNSETAFELASLRAERDALAAKAESPDLWETPLRAKEVMQALRSAEGKIARYEALARAVEDACTLAELAEEEKDEAARAEAEAELRRLSAELDHALLEVSFTNPHDERTAIVHIHAGAGGHDACEWAEMLLRMYLRWAEAKDRPAALLDREDGEEAGIRGATFTVGGPFAFGWLKGEHGVHRLVRISPFSGRRETSFASVEVLPELDEDDEIEIRPEELRIDTFRAGGHGGQHVNKTDSAVRITHLPTGIVVKCQSERSQHKNRANAMKILVARLYELREAERRAERDRIAGAKGEIAWGNQIRSYVLHPYQMVKDHRTGCETSDAQGVLDGALDPFLEANLREKVRA